MVLPNDNTASQIIPLILVKVRDHLQYHLFENVPDTSPTKAGLIKIGLFQENPANLVVSMAISPGDYDDYEFIDAAVDHPDVQEIKIRNLPRGEIGGGTHWWHRFSIRVNVFFVKENYDELTAIQHAYEFYGRLQSALENCQVGPLTDDYGERATGKPFMESTTFFPTGGKGKWIYRGKLRFRVLSWRP